MDDKILDIKVRKLTDSDNIIWDNFVNEANNGTIFHLRKFLSYHIERQFEDGSLIFELNDKILAVLPAAIIYNSKKKILHSHPGASYGGIVYATLNFQECHSIIIKLLEYCALEKYSEIFIIPSPQIFHNEYNDTLLYSLLWNNFEIKETYISSIIDLDRYNEPINFLGSRKQRYVKKLKNNKDIETKWCNNIDDFYPILCNNKKMHGSSPTHTLEELKKLVKIMPDSFSLLITYYNNIPIGGTFNFIANKRVAIIFYNMIDYNYVKYNHAAYQLYKTIEWGQSMNFNFLDFGVSQLPNSKNPLTPHFSLIKFKEQFGSNGMLRIALSKDIT